jgi:hypothetical protein
MVRKPSMDHKKERAMRKEKAWFKCLPEKLLGARRDNFCIVFIANKIAGMLGEDKLVWEGA